MKPPRVFSVGDRVRLRGFDSYGNRVEGQVRIVSRIYDDGDMEIDPDDGYFVTPSQCTRLVKRKAREWTLQSASSGSGYILCGPTMAPCETVGVREVKKREGR